MNNIRNHRVIIASLFLPSTVHIRDSPPITPSTNIDPILNLTIPPSAFRGKNNSKQLHRISSTPPGPPKSIVEDLRDKSSRITTPAVLSPRDEQANPFGGTPTSRKHETPPRLQRKHSRSSSRRADTDNSPNDNTNTFHLFDQTWHIEQNAHCNGGLKNAVDSVSDKLRKKLWVGTLGTSTDKFGDLLRGEIDRRMFKQYTCLPVWIPDAEFESCYDEFCHQVLWPCLHYAIPDAPKTKLFYESASYKQYVAVNQRFADAIIENYQDGDIIWVNDYHLMLLPSLLRSSPKLPPHVPIGFFMHVAFPSSEIFRCLSVRESLLHGILAADLIGFQTASYARHFRQTVSRIMAYEALPKGIQIEVDGGAGGSPSESAGGRFVDVGVFAMGIDVAALREKRRDPEVAEWVKVLRQRYAGMKIMVGRDKLDEIQGVRQKILAFEAFLNKNPEFQQKVVLIQVALQTTESNELAGSVADLVSHINSRFSTLTYQPVVFLHTQDLTFSQYLALLTVADAFLVTSLREGMALRTHEFVECQEERHRPLILSEFVGSYSYSGFRSCIAINPWDTRGTAKAILQALTMSDDEASVRWEELHGHVITQTAQLFVTSFLSRCLRANSEHTHTSSVSPLDVTLVLPRYKYSHKRLLLIDFEGTLWQRDISRAGLLVEPFSPPKEALELLNRLAEDWRNEVWLLSGLPVVGKMEVVAGELRNVGIVAENGCFIKPRPTRQGESQWINMVVNFNMTWKTLCLEILHYFTERTPGSFIEERAASIVWRFWTGPIDDSTDRQWARRQAAEAQNHIFDSLGERYGLRIIPGASSFLVLPNNISRSSAVGAILNPGGPARSPVSLSPVSMSGVFPIGLGMSGMGKGIGGEAGSVTPGGNDFDFVLAVSGDEKLLRRLNELDGAETCYTKGQKGKGGTDARWKLDRGEAMRVLWLFANANANANVV